MAFNTEYGNVDVVSSNPLFLSESNVPRLLITIIVFNSMNSLGSNRSIKITLCAKSKLRFIDGSCEKLEDNNTELLTWNHCDSMIQWWILNTMSKEIFESFMYAGSTKGL